MKKLLYPVLALALLLVVLYVGNIMYQRYSLEDGMTLVETFPQGIYHMDTHQGGQEFYVIKVVCKRKDRFNAVVNLASLFFEGEREDGSLYEKVALPEQPARFSYRDGIWVAQFYVMIFRNGYAGVAETFPTIENREEFLQTLVPFELPPNFIVWKPKELRGTSIGDVAGLHILHGEEVPVQRIHTTISARPQP